jgi:hypothetical protein
MVLCLLLLLLQGRLIQERPGFVHDGEGNFGAFHRCLCWSRSAHGIAVPTQQIGQLFVVAGRPVERTRGGSRTDRGRPSVRIVEPPAGPGDNTKKQVTVQQQSHQICDGVRIALRCTIFSVWKASKLWHERLINVCEGLSAKLLYCCLFVRKETVGASVRSGASTAALQNTRHEDKLGFTIVCCPPGEKY